MNRLAPFVALLFCVFWATAAQWGPVPDRDIVFPILNEKGLGDPCQVQYPGDRDAKRGFCARVRECGTFHLRVFYQPNFNVHRELCYFEIHDPVVCCLSARDAELQIVRRTELTQEWPYEFEKINMV